MRRCILLFLALASPALADVTVTEADDFSVDVTIDGRLVTDLLGGLWVLPAQGGAAQPLTPGVAEISRPRWSPNGRAIVFQARDNHRAQLHVYDLNTDRTQRLGEAEYFNQHPDWHPDGSRLIFSSDRNDSGFDLREMDVATGLSWRLTFDDGDEIDPAWSADGQDLVYVHQQDDRWSIVIRWFDGRRQIVTTSDTPLSSPAWRPDGSLITFHREKASGTTIDMAILSDPILIRPLVEDEHFFDAKVAWLNRQTFLYTAGGHIRQRQFDAWSSFSIPFRVSLGDDRPIVVRHDTPRDLPTEVLPADRFVLRVSRVFDGLQPSYRNGVDIIVDQGAITSIEPRQDRDGQIVIDMDGFTALPGYIDTYAQLPDDADVSLGPVLLSMGVTTLVTEHPNLPNLSLEWSGKSLPGPRLLPMTGVENRDRQPLPWLVTVEGGIADATHRRDDVKRWAKQGVPTLAESWQAGITTGAAMLLAGASRSTGSRSETSTSLSTDTLISGLADGGTPGLSALLNSRQADWLTTPASVPRRFAEPPGFNPGQARFVLGSAPNDLPPGFATHAEFLAMTASGLAPVDVLKSAGVNAALTLGVGLELGRIAPGSAADIVIVDGDPLSRVADLRNVVAVVRNGRFFSAIGLLERVPNDESVE